MSINKYFIIIAIMFLITGCGTEIPEQIDNNPEELSKTESFPIEEITLHNSQEDCWLLIDDKVYDVTKMIDGHAGGEAILQGCGIDATELYNTRPMGSGTSHSDKARSYLPNFYIGDLKN